MLLWMHACQHVSCQQQFHGPQSLSKCSQNGSNKQFWAMKLYGWSFQAPCCLTQTETNGNIFLILFSSLIGIDAPYSFLYFNIIILFSIIIFQMTVVVLCGHWGNHLHWYSSTCLDDSWLIYCFNGVLFFFFQIWCKKIHLLSSCFLSPLF